MASDTDRSWKFERGTEVVPGCTALEKLGGGHAYEAYVAFDERRYCPVVVKIVRPHLVADAGTLRGLRREVDLVGQLNHPVVVRGFHADVGGDRPYVALEHLQGPRLSTLLRKSGSLQPEQYLPLALQLSAALHYLAAEGVVHLDVKPSNIIMGPTPRLIDFSVARTAEAASDLVDVVGTDRYLAPEQAEPPASPGPAADVWGLGVTLFESVNGERPFPDGVKDDEADPAQRWPQLEADPRPFTRDAPTEVVDVISACLARDPADRPTPAAIFEAMEPLVHHLPKPRLGAFRPSSRLR